MKRIFRELRFITSDLMELVDTVLKASSIMAKTLIKTDYIMGTSEEAKAFLTHFLLQELGEERMYMLYLNRIPTLNLRENKKRFPDIILLDKDGTVFIKIRLIPRNLKARHAREKIWGKKTRRGGERLYGVIDLTKKFKKLAQMLRKETYIIFLVFDEKNYLSKDSLLELESEARKIYENTRIIHFNLKKLRELKHRGLLTIQS